jgi:hypothetical protein
MMHNAQALQMMVAATFTITLPRGETTTIVSAPPDAA